VYILREVSKGGNTTMAEGVGWDSRLLADIVLTTIFLFVASFEIGGFIRGATLGDSASIKMLAFFAVVALAGGLLEAHQAGVAALAKHNQGLE
jgi:hypothetical protein